VIPKILDYICHQLGEIGIANDIPQQMKERWLVINRAVDIRSASILYLARHIDHDATWLGIVGRTRPFCMARFNHSRESVQNILPRRRGDNGFGNIPEMVRRQL